MPAGKVVWLGSEVLSVQILLQVAVVATDQVPHQLWGRILATKNTHGYVDVLHSTPENQFRRWCKQICKYALRLSASCGQSARTAIQLEKLLEEIRSASYSKISGRKWKSGIAQLAASEERAEVTDGSKGRYGHTNLAYQLRLCAVIGPIAGGAGDTESDVVA